MNEFNESRPVNRERYETFFEDILGLLEDLVAEAEDAAADSGGRVIEENPASAQLWEEIKEKYGSAERDMSLRKANMEPNIEQQLTGALIDLRERAEAVFGAPLL